MSNSYQQLAADLSKLKELSKSQIPVKARRATYKDYDFDYFYVNSMHSVMFDKLEQKSALECKLDNIIDSLWYGKGGQIFGSYIDSVKKNSRTKDVYRSKSTMHNFPWYHKNRKY